MEHRRTTRIPKPMPLGARRRCGSCAPRPRISYSTAIPPNKCHPAPSNDTIPVELAPVPVVLGTVQNASHDGTTDASVQWQIPSVEGEQQHIQDLSSIRVISQDGDNTPSLASDVSGDDKQSIYSFDLPTLMSDHNEFALYPRFGKLNCLNLLHLQQHLYDLERKLEELDIEELSLMENEEAWRESSPEDTITRMEVDKPRQQSGSSGMSALSKKSIGFGGLSAQEKADRQALGCEDGQCHILTLPASCSAEQSGKKLPLSLRRCKLMGEVSKTLKAYNSALLSYSKIITLPDASHRDMRALKDWLQRTEPPLFQNSEALRFLTEGSTDVVAISARQADILEYFLQSRLLRIIESLPMWRRMFPSVLNAVATVRPTVQSRTMLEILRFCISLGGALLIVAPVVVLYFTRDEWARLVIICVCTIVFAVLMHVFAASDKKEVLMATTGYTAVLVVFVGSEAFADNVVKEPAR